jgi:hypothetical protein
MAHALTIATAAATMAVAIKLIRRRRQLSNEDISMVVRPHLVCVHGATATMAAHVDRPANLNGSSLCREPKWPLKTY